MPSVISSILAYGDLLSMSPRVTQRAAGPWRVWLGLLLAALIMPALEQSPSQIRVATASPSAQILVRGVAPDATADNSQRKLVVGARGKLYIAYVRPVAGIRQVILAQSSDGGRSWGHVQVSRSASPSRLPSLAVFADRSLHIVWTEFTPIGGVRYRSLLGGQWSSEAALSQRGVYAGVPVVAPVRGQPHVLWYGIQFEPPQTQTRHASIYEIISTYRKGTEWSTPKVISPGIPDSINPSLDVSEAGLLYAAWVQFDGRTFQVRYSRFDGTWSRPRSLTTGRVEHARVALAADGREIHLVWEEGGRTPRVLYQRLGGGPAVRISGPGPTHDPAIGASGGAVVAAWSEGEMVVLQPLNPRGPSRVLGAGRNPAVAVYQNVAYVIWTYGTEAPSELRFATVRLR